MQLYRVTSERIYLFLCVLIDIEFLCFNWLTGGVHKTMHPTFGLWSIAPGLSTPSLVPIARDACT